MKQTGKAKYRISALTTAVICIFALLVLFYLFLLSEEKGFFPGNVISRLKAEKYVSKYSEENPELRSEKFDGESYCFDYGVKNGDTVTIKVDGFKVTYDGYFEKYLRDFESENEFREKIKALFEKEPEGAEIAFYGEKIQIDYNELKEGRMPDTDKCDITLSFEGNNISYEEYRKTAAKIAAAFGKNCGKPRSLQIFYFRHSGEGEEEPVLQYESNIKRYQFEATEEIIRNSEETHYVVEVSEETAKKYKAKETIKKIYLSVLTVTIVALLALWLIRREKKRKKEQNGKNI